jgi:hypothetical protein
MPRNDAAPPRSNQAIGDGLREMKGKAWGIAKLSAKGCHIPAVIRKRVHGRIALRASVFHSPAIRPFRGNNMKKIALVAVAGLALATAACSKPAEEAAPETAADETAVAEDAMAPEAPAADAAATEAAPADAAAAPADAAAAPAEEAPAAE